MPRQIEVRIRGVCDYLQHKRPLDEEDTSKRSGKVDHSKEWESALYSDPKVGCYIPSKQIRATLVKGAVNFQIKGKGKKTYKDLVNATVEVDPDKISLAEDGTNLKKPSYIHQEWVKVQRSQVLRNRPAFSKGWEARFTLLVLDDQMPSDMLKQILGHCGSFVGIGDWRPHFGRFEVLDFKIKK